MKTMEEIREELEAIHKEQKGGKLSTEELAELFMDAQEKVPAGSAWNHYKGGVYMVMGHAFHTEDENIVIEYMRVDGPGYNLALEKKIIYARPIDVWLSENDDGQPRFVRQED